MSRIWFPLALVSLLVAELEYMLVTNFTLRTELREALHLPLYHLVLALLTLLGLRCLVNPGRLKEVEIRFSPTWLFIHLAFYALLLGHLAWLWQVTGLLPGLAKVSVWIVLGAGLLGTWCLSMFRLGLATGLGVLEENWWLLLIGLLAPYLAELTASWWSGFAGVSFFATEFLLQLGYSDVISEPMNLFLGTSRFYIRILPGCSGYEGMGLMALLSTVYVVLKARQPGSGVRLSTLFWLVPLSMALAWLGNVFRLVALIVIGNEISASIAMRGFHSQAGWICFTLLSFGLITFLEFRGRPTQAVPLKTNEWSGEFPALSYMGPLMAVMLAGLISSSLSDGFEYLYGLKVLAAGCALWVWRRGYTGLPRPSGYSLVAGLAAYAIWLGLAPPHGEAHSPLERLGAGVGCLWIAIRVVGSTLVAPVTEELFFRGFLLRRLHSPDFEAVSYTEPGWLPQIGSALAFGLLHQDWLAGFAAGCIYGWVARRPGGLCNAVVAHMVTNLALSLQVVLFSQWNLW